MKEGSPHKQDSRLRGGLMLLLTLGAIAGLAWYVAQNWHAFRQHFSQHPQWFLAVMALTTLQLGVQALCNSRIFRAMKSPVSVGECFRLAVAANTANQLLPMQSGAVIRAAYLKKRHNISLGLFVSATLSFQVLSMLTASLVILAVIWFAEPSIAATNITIVAAITAGAALLLLATPKPPHADNKLLRGVASVVEGWKLLRSNATALTGLVGLLLVSRALEAAVFLCACKCSGVSAGPLQALTMTSVVAISTVIRLTPGNLGVQESIYAVIAGVAGLTAPQTVAVSLTIRLAVLARSLLLAPIVFPQLGIATKSELRDPSE